MAQCFVAADNAPYDSRPTCCRTRHAPKVYLLAPLFVSSFSGSAQPVCDLHAQKNFRLSVLSSLFAGKQHCSLNGYELTIKGSRKTGRHGDCDAFVPETLIGSGG